jgi:hypothetical protein
VGALAMHAVARPAPRCLLLSARATRRRLHAGAAGTAELRRQQLERLLDPWGPSRVSWVKDHQLLAAHKVSLNVYHLPPPCCNREPLPGTRAGALQGCCAPAGRRPAS